MGMSEFYGPSDKAQSLATLEHALEKALPGKDIRLSVVTGPFEDNEGAGAFFEYKSEGTVSKQVLSLRRDFFTRTAPANLAGRTSGGNPSSACAAQYQV